MQDDDKTNDDDVFRLQGPLEQLRVQVVAACDQWAEAGGNDRQPQRQEHLQRTWLAADLCDIIYAFEQCHKRRIRMGSTRNQVLQELEQACKQTVQQYGKEWLERYYQKYEQTQAELLLLEQTSETTTLPPQRSPNDRNPGVTSRQSSESTTGPSTNNDARGEMEDDNNKTNQSHMQNDKGTNQNCGIDMGMAMDMDLNVATFDDNVAIGEADYQQQQHNNENNCSSKTRETEIMDNHTTNEMDNNGKTDNNNDSGMDIDDGKEGKSRTIGESGFIQGSSTDQERQVRGATRKVSLSPPTKETSPHQEKKIMNTTASSDNDEDENMLPEANEEKQACDAPIDHKYDVSASEEENTDSQESTPRTCNTSAAAYGNTNNGTLSTRDIQMEKLCLEGGPEVKITAMTAVEPTRLLPRHAEQTEFNPEEQQLLHHEEEHDDVDVDVDDEKDEANDYKDDDYVDEEEESKAAADIEGGHSQGHDTSPCTEAGRTSRTGVATPARRPRRNKHKCGISGCNRGFCGGEMWILMHKGNLRIPVEVPKHLICMSCRPRRGNDKPTFDELVLQQDAEEPLLTEKEFPSLHEFNYVAESLVVYERLTTSSPLLGSWR